jgi:hypothetical protein
MISVASRPPLFFFFCKSCRSSTARAPNASARASRHAHATSRSHCTIPHLPPTPSAGLHQTKNTPSPTLPGPRRPSRRANPRCASGGAAPRPPCSPPHWRSRWPRCGRRRSTRTPRVGRRCGSGQEERSRWPCSRTCITARTRGRTGGPRRTPRPTASWPPSSTPRTQVRACARSASASLSLFIRKN